MQEWFVESKNAMGEGGYDRDKRKGPVDLLVLYSRNAFHEAVENGAVYDGLYLANIADEVDIAEGKDYIGEGILVEHRSSVAIKRNHVKMTAP